MPKRFTLAEAQSLIPELERVLREALASKSAYDQSERSLRGFAERVMLMGGVNLNRDEVLSARSGRETAAARLRGSIEHVRDLGAMVKDVDIGLVDFPTLYNGEEVCLCWKLGEPEIAYWHGVSEGFAGRKSIDRDFLDRHQGDPAQ